MPELPTRLERTARGSIIWPVPAEFLPALPETLACRGLTLRRKAEFHLTVIGHDALEGLGGNADPLFRRLQRAWQELDPCAELLDELWLLRRSLAEGDGYAHSLAVACAAPAIPASRRLFAAWTGAMLAEALPHITLFWHGDPRGIAVPDRAAWRALCVDRGSWRSFGLAGPRET